MNTTGFRVLETPLQFVYLVVGQLLLLVIVLAQTESLAIEYLVVVAFLLCLVTAAFTAPLTIVPAWRSRLKWILLACFLIFGYVAIRQIEALWV